jgi:hypothetical protein
MVASRRYLVAGVLVVLGVLGALPYGAEATGLRRSHKSPAALTVRLSFHRVEADANDELLSNGRYVAFMPSSQNSSDVVIDSETGRRTAVPNAECPPSAIGPPWLLFDCGDSNSPLALYVFATRTWRTVPLAPAVPDASDNCLSLGPANCGEVDGIGADWIEFDETGYNGTQHLVFQNIATGEVRQDPTTATTITDLNSPSLARRLCTPLTTPYGAEYAGQEFHGSVQFYGRFVIASSENNGEQTAYLEHCGTKLHRLLTSANYVYSSSMPPMSATTRAVIWQSAAGTLTGLFFPGLQRFTVKLPAAAAGLPGGCSSTGFGYCFDPIALTSKRLYLIGQGGLWAAPSPSLSLASPRQPTRRHRTD